MLFTPLHSSSSHADVFNTFIVHVISLGTLISQQLSQKSTSVEGARTTFDGMNSSEDIDSISKNRPPINHYSVHIHGLTFARISSDSDTPSTQCSESISTRFPLSSAHEVVLHRLAFRSKRHVRHEKRRRATCQLDSACRTANEGGRFEARFGVCEPDSHTCLAAHLFRDLCVGWLRLNPCRIVLRCDDLSHSSLPLNPRSVDQHCRAVEVQQVPVLNISSQLALRNRTLRQSDLGLCFFASHLPTTLQHTRPAVDSADSAEGRVRDEGNQRELG
ncbi:hypothetical protein BLNAU_3034 [Blattamonas nauphoetae]|uniref:Uncharacterized protein n=1 Tax=Blattamonas nauphoetae TaxID=2049346 RepID=A0ABQ9YDZ5_9EUKA|nr:hypothetical protein BLNAU_3034 [Blattamonas nauphoetae]